MYKLGVLIVLGAFCSMGYGLGGIQGRILGGQEVSIVDVPYQASILYDGIHICGAVIIANNYVLTAAHCMNVFSNSLTHYLVKINSVYIDQGTVYPLLSVLLHDKYSGREYNVALVKLRISMAPVTLAVLQIEEIDLQGITGIAYGWGSQPQHNSTNLRQVNLKFVATPLCRQLYGTLESITDGMICAGNIETGGVGVCEGDFGGPIAYNKKIVGISSFSRGCGQEGYPSVFTKLSSVYDWIKRNLV